MELAVWAVTTGADGTVSGVSAVSAVSNKTITMTRKAASAISAPRTCERLPLSALRLFLLRFTGMIRSSKRGTRSSCPQRAEIVACALASRAGSWDESLFAGTARYYEQGRLPYAPGLADAFARILALDGRGRLLDVGCGPGKVTLLLAPLFEAVVGLDPDPEMLARASRAAAERDIGNATWVRHRAEALPAGLGSFRVVTFAASFHWMDRRLPDNILRIWRDQLYLAVRPTRPESKRQISMAAKLRITPTSPECCCRFSPQISLQMLLSCGSVSFSSVFLLMYLAFLAMACASGFSGMRHRQQAGDRRWSAFLHLALSLYP
jgi:SAM-dependent methyltransferase